MNDVWIVLISVGAGAVLSAFVPLVTHRLTKKRRRRTLALLVCPGASARVCATQRLHVPEVSQPTGQRVGLCGSQIPQGLDGLLVGYGFR